MKNAHLSRLDRCRQDVFLLIPGVCFCLLIMLAATYITEHYGSPIILCTLLLGMAFNNISRQREFSYGLEFCAKSVLRIGVALLGVRLTFSQISNLGIKPLIVVSIAVIATMVFSLLLSRLLKIKKIPAIISGAAVAICGVSAAMAVAAVLPNNKQTEQHLLCTVACVTGLSTVAMIVYPGAIASFGFTPEQIGLFLGASIHDVAQVFGAGHMISAEVAELATYTKMLRVAMLLPTILVLVFLFRGNNTRAEGRSPLLPGFLIAFVLLVVITNLHILSSVVIDSIGDLSKICLLLAMAALGTKTNLIELFQVGRKAFVILFLNTSFIAVSAYFLIR